MGRGKHFRPPQINVCFFGGYNNRILLQILEATTLAMPKALRPNGVTLGYHPMPVVASVRDCLVHFGDKVGDECSQGLHEHSPNFMDPIWWILITMHGVFPPYGLYIFMIECFLYLVV
jgi:hypothetical protein